MVQIRIAAVDDVRAMFGEQLADRRPRNDMREIENAKPLQGPERGQRGIREFDQFDGRRAVEDDLAAVGGCGESR